MAQYAVPPQFADFVSSKEQLLREMESGSGGFLPSDHVLYSVFPAAPLSPGQALALFEEVQQALARISSGYLWHRDELDLRLIVPESPQTVDLKEVFFHGCMDVGDCVEDEWFLVYMLQALSSEMRGLSIKVWDSDGHFLLIEAAEALPHWVSPDNAENRVWLSDGALLLISPEEGGRYARVGLPLPVALATLRTAEKGSLVCAEVQACIDRRTRDVYPAMTAAHKHTAAALLPRSLALLLQRQPHLLSAVVAVLCSADKAAKKSMAAMSRLGGLLRPEDMVLTEVGMTKTSYAKASFQPLHPPKKFHALRSSLLALEGPHSLLAAAGVSGVNSGAAQRSATKAFDFGCKLTCALEAVYHISKADAGRAATAAKTEEESGTIAAGRLGSVTADAAIALRRLLSARRLAAAAEVPTRGGSSALPRSSSLHKACDIVDCALMDEAHAAAAAAMPGIPLHLLAQGQAGQSDDWMYLTPAAFDEEISRVMGSPVCSGAASGEGASSSGGGLEEEELRRLEGVILSLGGFLSSESGLSGARRKGDPPAGKSDLGEYFSDDENEDKEDDEEDEEEEEEEEEAPVEHFVGHKKATLPHASRLPQQQDNMEEEEDSDDEEQREDNMEEEGADSDDAFMEEYHEAMDAQLAASTLCESFERLPGGGGVDEETNLVKSLLESRAGESGGAGPASLLLGQLGVELPTALQR